MNTHTQKMYVFLKPEKEDDSSDGYSLHLHHSRWGGFDDEEINITQDGIEVSVNLEEISRQEMMQLAIRTLQDKQTSVMAEAIERQTRLQEMINKLKLIEHIPETYET
tara:strand:+ start:1300 stop:1623 length:324 start_codon:yes stop_codon:yes gene_type:complete